MEIRGRGEVVMVAVVGGAVGGEGGGVLDMKLL